MLGSPYTRDPLAAPAPQKMVFQRVWVYSARRFLSPGASAPGRPAALAGLPPLPLTLPAILGFFPKTRDKFLVPSAALLARRPGPSPASPAAFAALGANRCSCEHLFGGM